MDFSVKNGLASKLASSCTAVGVFDGRKFSPSGQLLDKLTEGYLTNLVKKGDIQGKVGQTLLLHNVPNAPCERILLIGCGKEKDLDRSQFQRIIQALMSILIDHQLKDVLCTLTELTVRSLDLHHRIRSTIEVMRNKSYRFDQFKSSKDKKLALRRISFLTSERSELNDIRDAIAEGTALANGMDLARDLGNLPGNVCTPSYLANQAKSLSKSFYNISVNILNEADIKRLKMGAFLSVTRGSRQPPKLITIQYKGLTGRNHAPVVLVGKGITFDSGGISIKPSPAMDEMKYDMCGAASVFGTLRTIAELELPINVVGIIPTCENMPDGNASKPGDIVTSMSGQTIEILNTDAEGRLILCDALTYAGRFKPDTVIDIATLTGACLIALGKQATGMLTNNTALGMAINNAGITANDRVWELPLWDEYQEQLDSNFADMANIGGRDAGTITAACFLSRYTEKYHWAHLDIAGTAWVSGSQKGATGRPVPLLTQYLISKSQA